MAEGTVLDGAAQGRPCDVASGDLLARGVCQGCGIPLPPDKNPGNPRKWCSDHCRKMQYQQPCERCGAPCGGSDKSRFCNDCAKAYSAERQRERCRQEKEPQRQRILRLLAEGKTNAQIAERLGTTPGMAAQWVHRLRRYGYDVKRPPGPGRPPKPQNKAPLAGAHPPKKAPAE